VELDRPQHDGPTACVITQQRFSTTFISLRFHSHKEKFGTLFKMLLLNFLSFLMRRSDME
jgi:hypothetical protein